MDRGPIEHHL